MMRALLIMLLAMSCIPAGDAASKVLTSGFGIAPVYVVWTRFLIGALLLLPFTWRYLPDMRADWRLWARALLILGGISSITMALKTAPLADVFGAFFIGPIVSYLLSIWLLKEKAGAVQGLLVVIGFAGVLMIVRPGFDGSEGVGWAVLAGVFYGAFLTASRYMAGQAALGAMMLSQMVVPALVATPFALGALPEFSLQIMWLTLASAVFSMAGNVLLLFAYKMHEASKLAPFVYFQLVSATVLGWMLFGELPDDSAIAGMCLIIVSGAAVAVLQSRRPRTLRAQAR